MNMTTNYLARKLMSTRLDKTAISQFRWRKKKIASEKLKSVKCLRLVREQAVKSCRLCLRPGEKNIFSGGDLDLARDIQDVLGIMITLNDGFSQYICNDCEQSLNAALQFKQTAEITQWRLKQEQELLNEVFEAFSQAPRRQHGGYFKDAGEVIVREWYCKKCDSTFQSLEDFICHEMQPRCQSSKKLYMCEVCGYEARILSNLKRHRVMHDDGPGEFKCSYCNYRSNLKTYVKIHERWHTGEKPCKCQTCGKSFPNPSARYQHKKVHNPPKYHCHLCAKSFFHKRGLTDHIQTLHNKEPQHPCDTCGKEFMTRKKKLRHERSIHKRPRLSNAFQPPNRLRKSN